MSYHFTVEHKGDYLHCVVTGQNSIEVVAHYLSDVRAACVKLNCPNVLIEENLAGPTLKLADIFHVIDQASQTTWPYVQRIAYVDINPEHSVPDMLFAETVARNRGVAVKMFPNLDEAAAWLRK